MTIPFLDIFKKLGGRRQQTTEEPTAQPSRPVPTTPQKSAGERLSKTVMPNTVRSSSPDFLKAAGDSAPNVRAAAVRALPPTVALALQPKVERAISLPLSDVVERIPAGFLKPVESYDVSQTILLKASEIEKGMADGKPAVSLFSIYEQVPDIFTRNVRPDDATQIAVPHGKVLEQLGKMQVRDDQELETAVPQVDTPILKVTIEDTQRFGTTLPTLTMSADPPVKVEPASAQAFSSAEPEPAVQETVAAASPTGRAPVNLATPPPKITPRPSAPDPVAPSRIPFKLPPKGADGTATERVPASSSSSAPPSVPVSANPTRIPFKMTPPSDDLKPKLRLVPGVSADDRKAEVPSTAKISLGLRAVLQNVPSFQLHKPAESVPADVRVELPLSLVEPQMASGRVSVPIKTFRDAVPEELKDLLVIDAAESPVLLPLQEVLTNLSPDLLKMRDDQINDEVAANFETPFSIKAAEDARRFEAEIAESKSDAPVEAVAPENYPIVRQSGGPEEEKIKEEKKEEKAPALPQAKQEKAPDAPVVTAPKIEPEKKPAVAVEAKAAAPLTPPADKISTEEKPKISVPSAAVSVAPPVPVQAKKESQPPAPAQPAIKLATESKVKTPTPPVAGEVKPPVPLEAKKEQAQPIVRQSGGPVPIVRQSGGPIPAPTQPVLKLPVQPKPTAITPPVIPPVQSKPVDTKPAPPSSSTPPAIKISTEQKSPALSPKEVTPVPAVKTPKIEAPVAAKPAPAPLPVAKPHEPVMQTMPVPGQVPAPPPSPVTPAIAVAPVSVKPAAVASPNKPPARAEKEPEVNTSAKAVVEQARSLAGVAGATVMFEDGLALAGNLPDDFQAGGLCAIAPSMLTKINRHTVDTKFGPLVSMTLAWNNAQLSFFMAGTVCVGVVHSEPILPAETYYRLAAMTDELSRTYAQPGEKHVDH